MKWSDSSSHHLIISTGNNPSNGGGGGNGEGELELSYIWIANTQQGTISKIDTQTMLEEGRYQAKPSNGDPSRTSVNLQGDVAVANRPGGGNYPVQIWEPRRKPRD